MGQSAAVIGDHGLMFGGVKQNNETSGIPTSLRPDSLIIANKKSTAGPMSTQADSRVMSPTTKSPGLNKSLTMKK
jgi:hypothetical protein